MFVTTIGGIDRSAAIKASSYDIREGLGERATCRFVLEDTTPDQSFRPAAGAEVVVSRGVTRVFAGTIDSVDEEAVGPNLLRYHVACVDYSQLLDRHLVAAAYENQTADAIVRDIIGTWCAGEGLTTANVAAGPAISKAAFNYRTASEALTELAETVGYSWYVDYQKDVRFFPRETNIAPISIDEASTNYRNMRVQRTREQYRNRQYLRAGYAKTTDQTERFGGDGNQRTFVLAYPVAEAPTVEVNDVAQTVGIRGLDTGKSWYWNKGSNEVSQDLSEAALTASDVLKVTYKGLYPIIVQADSASEQSARATAEGGTGVYERVDEIDIDDADAARARALGLLDRYGRIPKIVRFSTTEDGLRAGQLISIVRSRHDLSGQFLIDEVTMRYLGSKSSYEYQVRCLDGSSVGGWADFFRRLAAAGRKFVIRDNEVVVRVLQVPDPITCSDTVTVSSAAPESRVGYAAIGYSEVA